MIKGPTGAQQVIRVLVVDDSSFIRKAICKMLGESPLVEVVDVAGDGQAAVDKVKALKPDVVTLDIKMPVMDGLAALEKIMAECPTPVVMLSSLTGKGAEMTLRALELGAVDFIDKAAANGPMEITVIASELIAKVVTAAGVDVRKLQPAEAKKLPVLPVSPSKGEVEVVLIGTSTGGPPALQEVLGRIPADFPRPILIVQHMPVGFTKSLAERLDRLSPIAVREAEDGDLLHSATAYIAPAGIHMKIKRGKEGLRIALDRSPEASLHIPSVDALFQSAASVCGNRVLAFVLTGMGKDGLEGSRLLKRSGSRVLVESEETSIVFGMPKAVADEVAVDGIVPLYRVAEEIVHLSGSSS